MRSVVICGSRRCRPEIVTFAEKLQELGVVVFASHLHKSKDE